MSRVAAASLSPQYSALDAATTPRTKGIAKRTPFFMSLISSFQFRQFLQWYFMFWRGSGPGSPYGLRTHRFPFSSSHACSSRDGLASTPALILGRPNIKRGGKTDCSLYRSGPPFPFLLALLAEMSDGRPDHHHIAVRPMIFLAAETADAIASWHLFMVSAWRGRGMGFFTFHPSSPSRTTALMYQTGIRMGSRKYLHHFILPLQANDLHRDHSDNAYPRCGSPLL